MLGIGCAWLGRRADGSIDREMGVQAVLAAVDAGIRLIDVASLYSQEQAEVMVREALRERPSLADTATSAARDELREKR